MLVLSLIRCLQTEFLVIALQQEWLFFSGPSARTAVAS
jgi:hypothetical protein